MSDRWPGAQTAEALHLDKIRDPNENSSRCYHGVSVKLPAAHHKPRGEIRAADDCETYSLDPPSWWSSIDRIPHNQLY
jgi:hypothetical protein